jgi:hypothetical protein
MTMVNGNIAGGGGGGGAVGNGKAPAKAGPSLSREDGQGHSKSISTEPTGAVPGILRDPTIVAPRKLNTDIPNILPHGKVFPIQIGSELFRLSGASISSDGMHFCSLLDWGP